MPMQEVQAGDSASIWGLWSSRHAEGSNRVRVPGAKVSPLLEKFEFLAFELIRDQEEALTAGI